MFNTGFTMPYSLADIAVYGRRSSTRHVDVQRPIFYFKLSNNFVIENKNATYIISLILVFF